MKWVLVFIILLNVCKLKAQGLHNLVVNGGFEEFSFGQCVRTANVTVSEYKGWYDHSIRIYSQNGTYGRTSPDSYNRDTCGISPVWNNHVPLNVAGFQYPHKGNGYIGLSFQYTREYASGSFAKKLTIGKTYCAYLYVSLAENFSTYSSKDFQMLLHNDSVILNVPWISQPGGARAFMESYFDTVKPITFQSEFLSDTLGWVKLETYFLATAEHKFFTIGNFKPYKQIDTSALRPKDVGENIFSYYYIDDVAIYDCSDTIPPPEPVFAFDVKAYPNPASEWFNFEYTLPVAGKVRLHITDVFGKMVLARTELAGQKGINTLPIDVNAWAMGQYHISVLYEGNGRSEYKHLKMQVVR